MAPPREREYISNEQLEQLKRLFVERLNGKDKVFIHFENVTGILGPGKVQDPQQQNQRLTWSRACRRYMDNLGLTASLRSKRGGYLVQVTDPEKWAEACRGIQMSVPTASQPQAPVELEPNQARTPESDPLIPLPDPDYCFPDFASHLLESIKANERTLLTGPTGSGKSSLVRELAARTASRFMRVNLNGETSVADLIGQWRIQGKEMVFAEGPVPTAMRLGAWLCLDELDTATAPVLFCLQALLEEGGKLLIGDTGEWIAPHSDFRIVATANTAGKGDDSGLYSGTNVLNEAFLDRFHSAFNVEYLPAKAENELLRKKVKGLSFTDASKMIRVAEDLRRALSDGLIFSTCSTRRLIAWGRKTVMLGDIKKAAEYTLLNRLSDDDRTLVKEILQRHIG